VEFCSAVTIRLGPYKLGKRLLIVYVDDTTLRGNITAINKGTEAMLHCIK
jgi:hypothetical protein